MKKNPASRTISIPPPPPPYRMADEIIVLLPVLENQQKATIKYFKAEVKAMNQFLDILDSISIKLPQPPPVIPMMPAFIKSGPGRFQKELERFYEGKAKRLAQYEKDLSSMPGKKK